MLLLVSLAMSLFVDLPLLASAALELLGAARPKKPNGLKILLLGIALILLECLLERLTLLLGT